MAIRTVLIDDLDDTEGATTHDFSLDGEIYEIDLSDDNFASLKANLEPYMRAGRKVKARGLSGRMSSASSRVKKAPAKSAKSSTPVVRQEDIRAWAKKNGRKVSSRGRIPRDVMDAFHEAHKSDTTPAFSSR